MARRQPEAHPPPPTPSPTPPATQLTRNGTITRRAGPPALPPAVDADFDFDFRRAPTENGSPPGTPDSYRTACDTPAALGTCNACGHRAAYVDYAESPGVVPAGGALANAANQGGLDALEELRLLKDQVRDVSRVCNAVATGDLTQKIIVPVQGDLMVQLKKVINTMVDNLGHFATEVTRVSRDVGTEGKLGAQAHVENVEGTWRELTDEVNTLAANLTTQVRSIAAVTTAVAKGDLSKQIEVSANGEILDLKNTVNGMVLRLRTLAVEVTRVTLEVGNQGKLGGEASVPDVEGVWFELVTNVNRMCLSLTDQVRSIATVTTAVARGDLSQKVTIQAEGEINTLKDTVNRMVDQLSAFASEVTRVALEVGTEGKLGGQARVEGVQGTWKDLTDNVNKMASNLTGQVRSISLVTKAVANGDLGKTMEVDVSGEMLDLKETINEMVMRLGKFASEVTRVALDVGTEGKARVVCATAQCSHPRPLHAALAGTHANARRVVRVRLVVRVREWGVGVEYGLRRVGVESWIVRQFYVRVRDPHGPARAAIRLRTYPSEWSVRLPVRSQSTLTLYIKSHWHIPSSSTVRLHYRQARRQTRAVVTRPSANQFF
ncbi:hypothetical protein FB451DRAFT_1129767 [Mycena latifolia]|nr:hypothetical protein FB451DRAFT_1129767 [Mycena latifolia]